MKKKIFLLIVDILLCLYVLGGVTNWYRYQFSLINQIIIIPLVLVIIFIVINLVWTIYKGHKGLIRHYVWFLSLAATVMFTIEMASGFSFIPFENHYIYLPQQEVSNLDDKLKYCILFENPFSVWHKEYLILDKNHEKLKIEIKLFPKGDPITGFISNYNNEPTYFLESTNNPNIFILNVSKMLIEKLFYIDLKLIHED